MNETLASLVGFALLALVVVLHIRRRRRLTPEQRIAEDTLNEARRTRRAVERAGRY